MRKNVAIIGAGVSGLSAGIHALQAGYAVDIYEKNGRAGGECTGWKRQGYHIDNCIHFLVGCNEQEKLYGLWKNLNVLGEEVEIYSEPYFYCLETDRVKLHLWCDIEKARKEFLKAAPEDEKELNDFFDSTKAAECIKPPCEMSVAHMNLFQLMKMGMQMKDAAAVSKKYGQLSMREFVNRFKNPYVRAMFSNYFNENFTALTFVTSYAFYTSNSVGIPKGGSIGMIERMLKKYRGLGGNIHYKTSINKVDICDGEVIAMETSAGEKIDAAYFSWCADPHQLFYEMIGQTYMDKNMKYMYDNPNGYVSTTGYQAAFGITTDEDLFLPNGSVIFPCKEYEVAEEKHNFCGIRVYDYDTSLFSKNKRVVQCNILQNFTNYAYWAQLKKNKEKYNTEKERIAEELRKIVETKYPQLKGRLVLLGTYTPATFHNWCNAYNGAYMGFNAINGYKNKYVKSTIKGLKNLFLASQWIQNGGGLPTAAASGKFAVQHMCKADGK